MEGVSQQKLFDELWLGFPDSENFQVSRVDAARKPKLENLRTDASQHSGFREFTKIRIEHNARAVRSVGKLLG